MTDFDDDPIEYLAWKPLLRQLGIKDLSPESKKLKVAIRNQLLDLFDTAQKEAADAAPDPLDDLFDDLGDEVYVKPKKVPEAPKRVSKPTIVLPPPKRGVTSQQLTIQQKNFYLKPDGGEMHVFDLPDEVIEELTIDPGFPIDSACYHPKARTWVCYSSAHIQSKRMHRPLKKRGDIALLKMASARVERGTNLPSNPVKDVPGRLKNRMKETYSMIPLLKSGVPDMENYPVEGECGAPAFLDANIWRPWLSNVLKAGPLHRVALFRWRGKASMWVIRDPYHLVVHSIPDEDAE